MSIGDGGVGEVKFKCTVAGVDVTSYVDELHIDENIQQVAGATAQISLFDPVGAINDKNFNGSYDQKVVIEITAAKGGTQRYEMVMLEGANVNSGEDEKQGGGHAKRITLRCVRPQHRDVHGNYAQFSKEDKHTNLMKKVLTDCLKVKEGDVKILDQSKDKTCYTASNKHAYKALNELVDEAPSEKYKGSTYCVYETHNNDGKSEYHITTFEERFKQSPVADLYYRTTGDSSSSTPEQKENAILNYDVDTNFTRLPEAGNKAVCSSFNLTTHGVCYAPGKESKYVLPGKDQQTKNPKHKELPINMATDTKAESVPNRVPETVTEKSKFLTRLAENSGKFTVPYNADISIGKMVNLQLPDRKDASLGENSEKQFNGKCFVSKCTTSIVQAGKQFRATKTLSAIKASFDA